MSPCPKTVARVKDVQRQPGREGHVLHDAPWRHETLGKGDRAKQGAGDSTGGERGTRWRRGQERIEWLHAGVLGGSPSAGRAPGRRHEGKETGSSAAPARAAEKRALRWRAWGGVEVFERKGSEMHP